jgi:hypothetical protein
MYENTSHFVQTKKWCHKTCRLSNFGTQYTYFDANLDINLHKKEKTQAFHYIQSKCLAFWIYLQKCSPCQALKNFVLLPCSKASTMTKDSFSHNWHMVVFNSWKHLNPVDPQRLCSKLYGGRFIFKCQSNLTFL